MLTQGEIEKGMLVTVHKWTVKKEESGGLFGVPSGKVTPTIYVGVPLLVKAISHPFVKVKILDKCYDPKNVTLNLNELELMEISKDFLDNPEDISSVDYSADDLPVDHFITEKDMEEIRMRYDSYNK